MKYCQKCGKEILDESVICPGCGCQVVNEIKTAEEKQVQHDPSGKISFILGIVGIASSLLIAIVGHICSIISIIFGIIDLTKQKKPTGLILGIIGEVMSIFSSIIGVAVMSYMFY